MIKLDKAKGPKLLCHLPTAGYEPDGLELHKDTLFIGAGRTVEAIDISDPAAPESLTYFHGEPVFTKPVGRREANAHDLVFRKGVVYVTAQRDGRVGVLRWARKD